MKEKLYCTLGWDFCPTTCNEDGKVFFRNAKNMFNKQYYPTGEKGEWPVNPDTGEMLEIWDRDKIRKEKRIQKINEYKQRIDMLIGAIFCGFVLLCAYVITAFLRAFGKKGK